MKTLLYFQSILLCVLWTFLNLTFIFLPETGSSQSCGFGHVLNSRLDNNEKVVQWMGFQQGLSMKSHQITQSTPQRSEIQLLNDEIVIPVVFHIIHSGEAIGTGNNISLDRIQHQLDWLNLQFAGGPDSEGIDAHIRFCFAQKSTESNTPWTNNEPGIMRYNNPSSLYSDMTSSSDAIILSNSGTQFSNEYYLNIYVIEEIIGGVVGYAFMQDTEVFYAPLSGIILEGSVVGSAYFGDTGLNSNFDSGNALVHEVGHVFSLYHPWGQFDANGCYGTSDLPEDSDNCIQHGDFVCDTPSQFQYYFDQCNSGVTNSCVENYSDWSSQPNNSFRVQASNSDAYDLFENIMNYVPDDACLKAFTQGQIDRMVTYIMEVRGSLVDIENMDRTGLLLAGGCMNGALTAAIGFDQIQGCALNNDGVQADSEVFLFHTYNYEGLIATNWHWDFGDGQFIDTSTPETSHIYDTPGSYTVQLTAYDSENNFVINSIEVIVVNCGEIDKTKSNWLFGDEVSLNFGSGFPVFNDLNCEHMSGLDVADNDAVSISDYETGELLFFSNGVKIWNGDGSLASDAHFPMYFTKVTGLIALERQVENDYVLFATGLDNVNEKNILVKIDIQVVNGEVIIVPGSFYLFPDLMPYDDGTRGPNNLELIPHCNGVDYWLMTYYSGVVDGNYDTDLGIFLVTPENIYNAEMTLDMLGNNLQPTITPADIWPFPGIRPALDGSKIPFVGSNQNEILLFDFNNSTGELSLNNVYSTCGISGIVLSPIMSSNSEYVYYGKGSQNAANLYRVEILTGLCSDQPIASGEAISAMAYGPNQIDDKPIYVFGNDEPNWGVIINPGTNNGSNLQYQMSSENYAGCSASNTLSTSNFLDVEAQSYVPLTFEYSITGCDEYTFTIPCYGNYPVLFDFGDGSPVVSGYGSDAFVHTFLPGSYVVTLTANPLGSSPITEQETLEIAAPVLTIVGADGDFCTNSPITLLASTDPEQSVSWSIQNGAGYFTETGTTMFSGEIAEFIITTPGSQTIFVTSGVCETVSTEVVINVAEGSNQNQLILQGLCFYEGYPSGYINQIAIGNGGTVEWDFGDGTPIETGYGVTHTYTNDGEYTITQTVSIPGCASSVMEYLVDIYPSPTISMAIVPSCEELCNGALHFATTGYIDFEGENLPSIQVFDDENVLVSFVFEEPSIENLCGNNFVESYDIQILDDNGCVVHAYNDLVIPANYSCCPEEVNISVSSACELLPGAPFTLSSDYSEEGAEFSWFINPGGTSTEEFPTLSLPGPGPFTAYLTITSPLCGELEQAVASFQVLATDDVVDDIDLNMDTQAKVNTFAAWMNNSEHSIGSDIIFGPNDGSASVDITISNATFLLGPGVDIIINENAVVNFIHCTFSSCQNWNGFDVRSNSANGIPPGELRFDATGTQSSEIRNAVIAIETRDERPDVISTPFYQRRAGVLECRRTIFKDNKSAIRITNAYQSPYQVNPHFFRCTFTVTDGLADHFIDNLGEYNQFRQHVSFNSVYKYNFSGCVFRNEMTDNPDILVARWQNRGTGIAARNSMFNIDKAFQNGQTIFGRFEGLDRGIAASGSKLRVSGQVFQENHIGALMTTSGASRFFTNTFHIGLATDIDYLDEQEYYGSYPNIGGNSWSLGEDPFTSYEGLVIYKGDLTEVAENNFIGYPQANDGISDTWARIGTRIRATNTQEMVVYNNNYNRLSLANLANADNAGGTGTSGLRYICNTNTLNRQDFTNTDFLGNTDPDNAAIIGNLQLEPAGTFPDLQPFTIWPTGNTFSVDNNSTATHFRNEGVEVGLYLHRNVASQTPTDYDGIDQLDFVNINHDCPNLYGTGAIIHSHADIQELLVQSAISQADADQLLYLYLLLLDDGNTEDLKIFVEDTWGEQVWLTRDYLLDISPFVSNTVLLEVLDNTTVYPHALAFEIMMANPNSLDNPVMMDYLSTKSDPMPSYMIDLLLAYEPGSTPRTELEINLAASRTKQISNASRALWAMMDYDDDSYSKEDIDMVISEIKTLNTEMLTVEELLNDGLVVDAIDRATNIYNSIPLLKWETNECDVFQQWVGLRVDMINGNRTWETMNASDLLALQNLVLKFDTYPGVQAMNVLNEFTDTDYFVPPAFGGSYEVKRAETSLADLSSQLLEVYPNPADYITTIRIKEALPTTQLCRLVIVDLLGREVSNTTFNPALRQVQVNTKDFAEGFYTYRIVIPNSQLQLGGKFEVIH